MSYFINNFSYREYPLSSIFLSYITCFLGYKYLSKLYFFIKYRNFFFKTKIRNNVILYFWNVMRMVPRVKREIDEIWKLQKIL